MAKSRHYNMSTRRWSKRAPISKGAANRKFARKKLQWIDPFCVSCTKVCADPLTDCPNGFKIPLMENADLQAYFEDSCRVLRILGHVYFQPLFEIPDPPCLLPNTGAQNNVYMRVGLKRSEVTDQDQGVPRAVNPMDCGADPLQQTDGDFSEARFMHQWEHNFDPRVRVEIGALEGGCCPEVTGGASAIENGVTWAVTEGAIDTTVETECVPCEADPDSCSFKVSLDIPPAWHLAIDWTKPINLRDNHSLNLWVGWERMTACDEPQRPDQGIVSYWGGLRLLVEK